MPGNIAAAQPAGVLPQSLCTAFTRDEVLPMLKNDYHDGPGERMLISDGVNVPAPIRTWTQTKRLTSDQLATLRTFFEGQGGGLIPFYFYDPFEVEIGQAIGSNFDPSGDSIIGRFVVVFQGDWSEATDLGRSNTPLKLAERA